MRVEVSWIKEVFDDLSVSHYPLIIIIKLIPNNFGKSTRRNFITLSVLGGEWD